MTDLIETNKKLRERVHVLENIQSAIRREGSSIRQEEAVDLCSLQQELTQKNKQIEQLQAQVSNLDVKVPLVIHCRLNLLKVNAFENNNINNYCCPAVLPKVGLCQVWMRFVYFLTSFLSIVAITTFARGPEANGYLYDGVEEPKCWADAPGSSAVSKRRRGDL